MASRFKRTINIITLFVIIGFGVSVYLLSRIHDANSAKKAEIIYLPKHAPEYMKDVAREEYTLVEIEPNDSRHIRVFLHNPLYIHTLHQFWPFDKLGLNWLCFGLNWVCLSE